MAKGRSTNPPWNPVAEKVVSHKYRYIWISVPKAASRSVKVALGGVEAPDSARVSDESLAANGLVVYRKPLSEIYAAHPEVKDYFSFAFIRHPFCRAHSFYTEMRFHLQNYDEAARPYKIRKFQLLFDRFPGLAEVDSFDDYCQWLNSPYGSDAFADMHFISQHMHITDAARLPDFIGRLESLDEDLKQVASRLSMPALKLPVLNTMIGWRPSSREALQAARSERDSNFTARNRALLSMRYAVDLELHRAVSAVWGILTTSGSRTIGPSP